MEVSILGLGNSLSKVLVAGEFGLGLMSWRMRSEFLRLYGFLVVELILGFLFLMEWGFWRFS